MIKKITAFFTLFTLIIMLPSLCFSEEANYTLLNSGFEEGTEKYGVYEGEGAKMTITDTIANTGNASLQINVGETGHTSIWQVITPDRLSDKIKVSAYIYYENDVDAYNPDFALRLEVIDGTDAQFELIKTETLPKDVIIGKWNYIETPYIKLPRNTKLLAISFVNNMRGTVYIDDLAITGEFSSKLAPPKVREETALSIIEGGFETGEGWNGDFSVSDEGSLELSGEITQLINVNEQDLDKLTSFGVNVKGTARITVEGVDYYGYKSVIARSKTINSPEEFVYLETDKGVILKRSQSLLITITGSALLNAQ